MVRYACVSHCWGHTRSKHITNRHNVLENTRGIPIAELPKTFRDAIEITGALGLEYLWIDSLCIVQDDPADWIEHVESMADIYQNAYITLAAGDSIDDDGGFFQEGVVDMYETRVSNITKPDLTSVQARLRLLPPHTDDGTDGDSKSPLYKRGWIFQERYLSRRFLCFRKNEIQWECLDGVACTCSSIDGNFNPSYLTGKIMAAFPWCESRKYDLARLKEFYQNALHDLWRDLVRMYSFRSLTFAKDRLPALAGLAKAFSEALRDTYLHGHWQGYHRNSIRWYEFNDTTELGRPKRHMKVPSWSWAAAADGSNIYWIDGLSPTEKLVLNFEVTAVQDDRLRLTGDLSSIRLRVSEPESRVLSRWCESVEMTEDPSSISATTQKDSESLTSVAAEPQQPTSSFSKEDVFLPNYRFWSSEEALREELAHVYFFDVTAEGWDPVEGLVLRKVDTEMFERIGLLRAYKPIGKPLRGKEWEWYLMGKRQTVTIV